MLFEQGAELVAGRRACANVVIAQAHEGLKFSQAAVDRHEAAQAVAVGAQVVGEFIAVTRIGLGAGGAPSRPGGMEGGGVHGHDRISGLEQAVDDQPTGTFDDDGQFGRGAVAGQPGQSSLKVGFAVLEGPMADHHAAVVNDGHVMAGAGPVPSTNINPSPSAGVGG